MRKGRALVGSFAAEQHDTGAMSIMVLLMIAGTVGGGLVLLTVVVLALLGSKHRRDDQ